MDSSQTWAIDFASSAGRQRDGQDLGLEPGALADRARHVAHEAVVAFLHLLGVGLLHAAVQERHHAFEVGVVGAGAAVAVLVPDVHLLVAALEDRLARLGGQLAPRGVDVEAQRLAEARRACG